GKGKHKAVQLHFSRAGHQIGQSPRDERLTEAGHEESKCTPIASMVVSVSTGRSTWLLLAPRAARIASSLRRAIVRASTRFAVLAQAISRTNPTAPRRISNGRRASPTRSSRNRVTIAPHPLFSWG